MVCVLKKDRTEVVPKFTMENSKSDYEKLVKTIGKKAKIAIENTGSYSLPLYNYLKKYDYDAIMIKGVRMKKLREYIEPCLKTDPIDCEVLALVRLLEDIIPTVNLKAGQTNTLKPVVRLYCTHVRRRAKLRQQIMDMLQKRCPELMNAFYKPACMLVLTIIRYVPHGVWHDAEEVIKQVKEHGVKMIKRKDLEKALSCLRDSVGVGRLIDSSFELLLDMYFAERRLVKETEEEMAVELLRTPYATLVLLENVNLATAAILAGAAGDIRRFSKAKKFVKYCGFIFTREQSGAKDKKRLRAVPTDVR
jgi:transposase